MTSILNFLKSIIALIVNTIIDLVNLLIDIPLYIAEALEATGGVFSIFSAFLGNIPDRLWLGILLSASGIFLMKLLYGKNSNSKGGT